MILELCHSRLTVQSERHRPQSAIVFSKSHSPVIVVLVIAVLGVAVLVIVVLGIAAVFADIVPHLSYLCEFFFLGQKTIITGFGVLFTNSPGVL